MRRQRRSIVNYMALLEKAVEQFKAEENKEKPTFDPTNFLFQAKKKPEKKA